jgi:hypothetical protein
MERSTTLLSISIRPSSMKRLSPSQRDRAQRIASASVVFWLMRTRALVRFGLAARKRLLDVLQAEQKLIFRQRLGPAAEAMALQFLDNLFQPLGARVRPAASL